MPDAFLGHRWSGWPGAWCLDCGAEDMGEVCVANHSDGLMCECGVCMCETVGPDHKLKECAEHVNGPCLEQNSQRCDPYKGKVQ